MNKNEYSIVDENVKVENEVDDDYLYYDRTRFGKKYCIACNRKLTDQDVDELFSIILKKEKSMRRKSIFKKKYSCTKEISKYFDCSCYVQEYENRSWLIDIRR